jgi:tRNA pseudouridine55 synthase
VVSGLLLLDKPAGVTSHAVVGMVKRALKRFGSPKVGHLGTLDPFASGVLPIMVGGLTRLADDLHTGTKGYLFRIQFGSETDTLDPTGLVAHTAPLPELTRSALESALLHFRGCIVQTPPAYSALKHKGRPLYEYMRTQGHLNFDLAEKAREVTITSLENRSSEADYERGSAVLHMMCSKGTYVRSLCRDIALTMGTRGHCSELRRTMVGPWAEETALPLLPEHISQGDLLSERLLSHLISPLDVLPQLAHLIVPVGHPAGPRLDAGNGVEVSLADAADWTVRNSRVGGSEGEDTADAPSGLFLSTQKQLFLARMERLASASGLTRVRIQPEKRLDSGTEPTP